ncbi:hypothetical protein KKF45_04465 [Patescibacteria group bacterium]|nr:hypothetical protein [Patescibacteria group bacterium]
MKLLKYEKACNDLKDAFLKSIEFFGDEYWIGDTVGEVLCFGDYFMNMNHMADYFRYDYTPEEFWDWYDQYIDEKGINMKSFKYFKK